MPTAMRDKIVEMAAASGVEPKGLKIPAGESGWIRLPTPKQGDPTRFVVRIEGWHPTTLNVLVNSHYMEANRRKTADADLVAFECYRAGVTKAVGRRRVRLAVILAKGQRSPDPDAFHKSLHDSLVRCGALVDDNAKWLDMTTPTFERSDTKASRIVIEDI